MHAVDIELMGKRYTIRTDDDPARVHEAAAMVQERVEELRRVGAAVASDRLLLLVALNLAGELIERGDGLNQHKAKHLLSALDHIVSVAKGLADAPLR